MLCTASKFLVPGVLLLLAAGCSSPEDAPPNTGGSSNYAGGAGAMNAGGVVGTGGNESTMDAANATGGTNQSAGGGGNQGIEAGAMEAGPTPSTAYVYIGQNGPTITIMALDMATGKLSPKGSSPAGGQNIGYLAFSPDRQFLYVVNEADGSDSKVFALKINRSDGSLSAINSAPTGGSGAPHLSVHPGGKLVLVAHYNSGDVSTLKVDNAGGLAMPPADVQHPADKTSHQIICDPSGKFVFVPNVDSNTIFQFTVDAANGKLTANGQVAGFPPGAGPRHMALHPNGRYAYTTNEVATTVTSLTYDSVSGNLANPQTIDSLPVAADRTMASGAHILVHPGGKFVFASNRGHNSISVFAVDANGRLTQTSNETAGGMINNPRDFALDPSGKFLVVANQEGASVIVLEINPADGKLTQTDILSTPPNPSVVGVVFL